MTYALLLAALAAGGIIAYPSSTSADVASMLASVFENKNIQAARQVEPVVKNAQTMSLLQAPHNPNQASSTVETLKTYKTFVALVDDNALTNENSAAIPGASDAIISKEYSSDRISLYTVHKGDSIEQIADMYDVNVSTILWANDMKKGTPLKVDQVLVILPISGLKYTVKKGDTIASVARAYKSDADEIANFNNIEGESVLSAGDEIIIPDAEGTLVAAETKKIEDAEAKTSKAAKDAKAKKTATKTGTAGNDNSSATHVDTSGYFIRPIKGGVRTQGLHGHNGVDLASMYGTPILAAASGQVVVAKSGGWNGGYGNYVVIQHSNGTQTLYGHLSSLSVKMGDSVSQGEQIGGMGNTGDSTGIHLHFEVRGGKNPF